MIADLWVFAFLLGVIAVAAAWKASRRLPEEVSLARKNRIEDLLPLHTQHFPQLRQSLDSADLRYVQRNASKETERMWREDRQRIVQGFLSGLAGDFARVNRLAEVIASLSGQISRREELERGWLSMQFRLNYGIVSAGAASGGHFSLGRLARLTEVVASLSAHAEASMADLEAGSHRPEVPSNFSA